ncbi:MAG: hypothetical protein ACKO91_06820 [Acidimicrobiales bacterium]
MNRSAHSGGGVAYGFVGLGTTQQCVARSLGKPFAPFGDGADYFLVPGGDFDTPTDWFGWSLLGSVPVVADQPRVPGVDLAGYSLQVLRGTSARSPGFCVRSEENLLRFFVQSQGDAPLDVVISTVARTSMLNRTMRFTIPAAQPGRWRLSPAIPLPEWHAADGTVDITIRFEVRSGTKIGLSSWLVDDVFVDPFKPY